MLVRKLAQLAGGKGRCTEVVVWSELSSVLLNGNGS
jgi:hypothetical protein